MKTLSDLVKDWQRKVSVQGRVDAMKPEWVDKMVMIHGATARVDLLATVAGKEVGVVLTPSWHGVHVKVVACNDPVIQSRLSRELSLRLNV